MQIESCRRNHRRDHHLCPCGKNRSQAFIGNRIASQWLRNCCNRVVFGIMDNDGYPIYHRAASTGHFCRKQCPGHAKYGGSLYRQSHRNSHTVDDGIHAAHDEFDWCYKRGVISCSNLWDCWIMFSRGTDHHGSFIRERTTK